MAKTSTPTLTPEQDELLQDIGSAIETDINLSFDVTNSEVEGDKFIIEATDDNETGQKFRVTIELVFGEEGE